ncbi:MAG: hypothetical protein NTX66_01345 [Candidatus Falkowbacteria bacterium]|nr:hypothetical protein [Candidatus Falkowbacteria bacterium]
MNYPLIAFLVSLGTVFVLPMIGTLLYKESNKGRAALATGIVALMYFFVLWLGLWYYNSGLYGPSPLFWSITIGLILGAIFGGWHSADADEDEFFNPSFGLGAILAAAYILYALGGWIMSSDWQRYDDKAHLFGKVEIVKDVSTSLQPADPAHICLVSDSMAENSVHTALSNFKVAAGVVPGSRYKIGEGTKQFVDGQLWWIFPVEFDGYFKWKQDKQVPGYLRVSAEDPTAQPQAVQFNKKGEEIHVKYLNSACYELMAVRYLRHNGYAKSIFGEFTYEVDDDWNPFYVAPLIERTTAFTGYVYTGIVLLDIQSGKFQHISKEELASNPKWHWIDRGADLEILQYQLSKWGQYDHSTFWDNFWHGDKVQKSDGDWYLVYSGNRCFFLTDMTSNSSDQALTGFAIFEGATGRAIFYSAVGVTAKNASQAASSLWANYPGTKVAELVPYNIDGHMTYVVPMIKNKQFMGVSLICMYDKNICAMGTTFDRALAKYRMAIDGAGHNRTVPNGGKEIIKLEISGEISEVGMPIMIDQQQYFFFMLKGVNKSFEIPYNNANLSVPYLKAGKNVRLTYTDTKEPVIICDELEIIGLKFSNENPNQARYVVNQGVSKKEVEKKKK